MKRNQLTAIFISILCLWSISMSAQDVTLTSQLEVDAFDSLTTTIAGNLIISGNDIADLSNLSNITSIGGILSVNDNDVLTNLDGLSNLITVGGDLSIYINYFLKNLDGLSNLTSVGGNLTIDDNYSLRNLDPLINLTSMNGNLSISFNDSLTNIDGLSNLITVGGDLSIENNFFLTNLDGLSNLTSVGGYLYIFYNGSLTNIDGLSNLIKVGDELSISDNFSLTNLDGLSNLTSVGGQLHISGNIVITNIDGLSNIDSIGASLAINGNDALTNIDGLTSLTTVDYIDISYNASLANIDGLSNLDSISSDLVIADNASLTNINGVSNFTTVGGYLSISNNDALTNIDALSQISSLGYGLNIAYNDNLTNLDGLSQLSSLGFGILYIIDNDALTNIDALSQISQVIGNMTINDNAALTNLGGLNNITLVTGWVEIIGNPSLTNLFGLSNLTSIQKTLTIENNPVLTSCCGIQDLLSTSGAIDGIVDISNNPSECSSMGEILNSNCGGIAAKVFYDENENGIREFSESVLSNIEFKYKPVSNSFYTGSSGVIRLRQPFESDIIKLVIPKNWSLTTAYDSIDLPLINNLMLDTFLFGLSPNKKVNDLTLNIAGNRARCNTEVSHQIVLTNTGTTILEGTLETTNIDLMDYVDGSASPIPNGLSNGQLTWNFSDVYPNESFTVDLNFLINGPDNIGDSISLNAKATVLTKNGEETTFTQPDNGDLNDLVTICHCTGSANTPYVVLLLPQSAIDGQGNYDHANHGCDIIPITDRNNDGEINRNDCLVEQANYTETTFFGSYKSEIRCSYDPNDKLANPAGQSDEKWTLMGQDIIYTIRFQNTGNDTAYKVELIDTLNQFLDINTFDFITSSHPDVDYSITAIPNSDYHVLNFVFEDIYLPDSTTDQPGSNGFVQFSIRPYNDLPDSTAITNDAGIYFDFNPPIITNEAEHTLVFKIPDYKAPNAICKTVHTVYVDESGSATVAANEIDNNSTDNVGIDTREVDKTAFNCQQLGNNTIELTVYDAVGNSDKCSATISVKDTIRPSIICLDTTINLSSGSTLDLTAEDLINNASDNCGVTNKTISKNIFTDVDAGSNTVVIEAVDASNNKATCTSKVEISVVSNLLESVFGITSTLSPNPSSSYVVLSLSKALPFNYDIGIVDLSGKLVTQYLNQSGITKTIDVHSLAKGMYFLNLTEQGKSEILSSFKMLVE